MSEDQSSERATKYFGIDEVTGEIQVLEDLKRELFENYLLSVVATDQGEPPISASMTIVVQVKSSESNSYSNLHWMKWLFGLRILINCCFLQVQQVVTVAPGTGIGFEEVQHEIQVKEQAVIEDDDKILLHSIKLDRGKAAEYTNEIERPSFETLNQVSVDCSIDGATDDNNVPIRGK